MSEKSFYVKAVECTEFYSARSLSPFFGNVADWSTFKRILDCGTGIGSMIKLIDPYLDGEKVEEIIGIDINPALLEEGEKRKKEISCCPDKVRFQEGDVYKMTDFPDNYFDLVGCRALLQHAKPEAILSEVKRVLKPGGVVLAPDCTEQEFIMEPVTDEERKLDDKLITNFYKYRVEKPRPDILGDGRPERSDVRCGRKLWHYLKNIGFVEIVYENSPLFLYPNPKFSPEEKELMKLYIEGFVYNAGNVATWDEMAEEDRIDRDQLEQWKNKKLKYIEDNEMVFYINMFGIMAKKPV